MNVDQKFYNEFALRIFVVATVICQDRERKAENPNELASTEREKLLNRVARRRKVSNKSFKEMVYV